MRNLCCYSGVLLAGICLLAGCAEKDRDLTCETVSDCQANEICFNGVCVPVDCKKDSDCAEGELCQDNECINPDACINDEDCTESQACIDNLCSEVECKTDLDCAWNETCVEFECVSTVPCEDDSDCQIGEICVDNLCVNGCKSSRDCPDSLICMPDLDDHGRCVECGVDADCPSAHKCVDFECVLSCESDSDCVQGYCHLETGSCVECVTDGHCGPGLVCEENVCEAGCRLDEDCGAGAICENNSCRPGCREDADCATGVCDLTTNTCTECADNDDCDLGMVCVDLSCTPGCEATRDCPEGTVCATELGDHGTCVECLTDQDCAIGECDLQTYTCTECSISDDCEQGYVCDSGHCVPGCQDDLDCPAGTVCLPDQGPHGICAECMDDQDCLNPDLPRCEDYQCVPECTTDEHCPVPGEFCVNNHCQELLMECDLRIEPPTSVLFGNVPVDSVLSLPVLLSNQGGLACNISELELRPSSLFPADFTLIGAPTTPFVLNPRGQSGYEVEFVIEFTPTSAEANLASLWITSDDPDLLVGGSEILCMFPAPPVNGQACMRVSGAGVQIGLEALPDRLDFGQVSLGCDSATRTVRFYNFGAEATVTDARLANPGDDTFIIVDAPVMPFTLPLEGDFEISLAFRPPASGTHSSVLTVDMDALGAVSKDVPLTGYGTNYSAATDTFNLPADVQVDVLWIVDNSGSMAEVQAALASNFDDFIEWATSLGVDYHIGVIATEVNDPETGQGNPPRDVFPGVLVYAPGYPSYITPQTQNPIGAFSANVQLGTCCSDEQEAGLQAAWMAMTPPLIDDQNAGFLREQAKLYVIAVSDEQDQSAGPIGFYNDFLTTLKGQGNQELVKLSAIVADCPNGCPNGTGTCGSRYIAVAEDTGGFFRSICSGNWSALMQELGEDAFEPIRTFVLSRPATEHTIIVKVNGQTTPQASAPYGPDGWTYLSDDNAIWFGHDYVPTNGSQIEISYTAACL